METRIRRTHRLYSKGGWTDSCTLMRTEGNVAITAVHVSKPNKAVAWPAPRLTSKASQDDVLHIASRFNLPPAEAHSQQFILMAGRAIVVYKYSTLSQSGTDQQLEPGLRVTWKQAAAEPCLKFVSWLEIWLSSAAAYRTQMRRCPHIQVAHCALDEQSEHLKM